MNRLVNRSLLLLLTLSASCLAQSYNVLAGAPSCAQQCSALTTAQSSCNSLYPSGPFASVASCFCTTPTIAAFGYSAGSICPNCADDVTAVEQWFGAYCAAPATVTAQQAAAASTSAAAGTSTAVTSVTTTAAVATATNSLGIVVPVQPESYWQAHGRWIIMVIVLVAAFSIIIAVGVIWKKRYNKKRNAASELPPGSVWGPNHRSHPDLPNPSPSNLAISHRAGNDTEKATSYVSNMQRSETDTSMLGQEEKTEEGKGRRLKRMVGK